MYCLPAPQLYAGAVEPAMRTALHLRDYEDVLDPCEVHSFLALASFYAQFYGTCSKVGDQIGGGDAVRWGSQVVALVMLCWLVLACLLRRDPCGSDLSILILYGARHRPVIHATLRP